MAPTLAKITAGFLILGLVFFLIEKSFPAIRTKPLWRKDSGTDLIYWFFTPLVTRTITRAVTLIAVVFAALLLGRKLDASLAHGFGPLAAQPPGWIALEMLLVGDLVAYWIHRAFHRGRLWRFHAIHHSSTQLDWLSSVRLHPVNDMLTRSLQAVVLLTLGFPLVGLAFYVPFLSLFALFLHANVAWSFGPLRYLIASPTFHRWHHTAEDEGLDKNFAGLFPVFDLMFGTFHMPVGRRPERFGIHGQQVPQGFFAQMLWPFKKPEPAPSTAIYR